MTLGHTTAHALLITPQFFGYEQEIELALINFGFKVDLLPDRPFNSPFMKAVLRFRPELVGGDRTCDHFFAQHIEGLEQNKYSIIIVIQGEGISVNILNRLRSLYPQAKMVFYLWDSIENKPFTQRKLSFFDYCSTFDPVDAKRYGLNFRPLFYSNRFDRSADTAYTYDLSFIGTMHSDRYKVVHAILNQLQPDARTFVYLYLQASWMYDFRRIFTNTINGAKREDFQFTPLDKAAVQAIFFSSGAVLDIEHPNQRGATMRTIEALGSRRKLVTTNETLYDYDFYNPLNIQIVDRQVPRLDRNFLQSPYQPIPEEIRRKYSISEWISEICG